MTTQIYTVGYGRLAPGEIHEMALDLGAILVDIRFSAWGKPGYKKFELVRLFGDRYTHLPALGNAAYKTGGMQIADYAAGRAFLVTLGQPAILMCACADPDGCHRTVVGAMLAADGFNVTELNRPTAPVDSDSFGVAAARFNVTELNQPTAPAASASVQMSLWSEES